LFALRILAEQFLLYFQCEAVRHRPMTMKKLGKKLDELIAVNDDEVFPSYLSGIDRNRAGRASRAAAARRSAAHLFS
jgi:hypothetical protein